MAKCLCITATGTDMGKTYVSALVVKKLVQANEKVAYFKPAMSGNSRDLQGKLIAGDAEFVRKFSGLSQEVVTTPYVYEKALSPHLASRLEQPFIELDLVLDRFNQLKNHYDYIVVEGIGGIVCPLKFEPSEKFMLEDFIQQAQLSCVIVAHAGLGTINATTLTAHYLRSKPIPVQGVIFNFFDKQNPMHLDNRQVCEELNELPTLACVKENCLDLDISLNKLKGLFQ